MPEISVIIPVYNVEKYIAKCLESVLAQSLSDIEIFCIDDCATDNSAAIAEEYAKKDSRIKIIRHKINKGLGAARNTGLEYACGKYVYFLDSDDYIDGIMLEKAHARLEESGCDSVWMLSRSYFEDEKIYVIENYLKNLAGCPEGIIEINAGNISDFPGYILNKVYSLDFIKKNNLLFPEGLLYEDAEFYFKFYTKSSKVFFMREVLCTYVRRQNSITFNTEQGLAKREDICQIAYNIYLYLRENGLFEKYQAVLADFILRTLKY
jgi:glycosyltransferase involved in cell wall biosynthesis